MSVALRRTLASAIIAFLLILLSSATAIANTNGLSYSFDDEHYTATVIGVSGDISGNITIPATVEHGSNVYTVVKIGANAFKDKTAFNGNITLPETITEIGTSAFEGCCNLSGHLLIPSSVEKISANAFKGCSGLVNLTFDDVGNLSYIGDYAFANCSGLATTWRLPSDLTYLGKYAFTNCLHMSGTVTIPAGLTEICEGCFYMEGYSRSSTEKGVQGIIFPDNSQLTRIGDYAFAGNWEVSGGLDIPDAVEYIGNSAFYSTHSTSSSTYLKGGQGTLKLPANLKTIGESAFNICDFAGDLTIPSTVETIGDRAFERAGFTGTLTMPEGIPAIPNWCFAEDGFSGTLQIPSSIESIGYDAFWRCPNFNSTLTIPEGVTEIGSSAFQKFADNKTTFGTLTLPPTLVSIGDYAFNDCIKFDGALNIPDSVETIGKYAFNGCRYFTSLHLPDNPNYTVISEGTFGSVWNYQMGFTGELDIPINITSIEKEAFEYCGKFTGDLVLPPNLATIGEGAFQNCPGFTGTLDLPAGLTTIGPSAFYFDTGFTGLVIPNTVTSIGQRAFFGCEHAGGDLVIPGSVKTIGREAFGQFGCKLEQPTITLTIEEGVENIGDAAFGNCSNFTGTITLPSSLNAANVGRNVFSSCTHFTGYSLPDGWTSIPDGLFNYCRGLTGTLTIPSGIVSIGREAFNGCSGYTGVLVFPDTVTNVGDKAFARCSGLTGYSLPSSWTSIPSGMFYEWTGLSGTLTIPANITSIGNEAFYGCKNLTALELPNTLDSIGNSVFYNCSGFTGELIIPQSVKTIGSSAFQGCSGFTGSLSLPSGITDIGASAFEYCSNLTGDVTIPQSVSTLSRYLFYGCTNLTGTLTIPSSITSGYYETLYRSYFSKIVNNSNVSFNEAIIVDGTNDYYINEIGETVTVIGPGTYTRVIKVATIDLKDAVITVASATYNGGALKPALTVKVADKTLASGDYTAVYADNVNAGTSARVTITGVEEAGYSGSKTATFKISPASISGAAISGIAAKTYNGQAQTQAPTVKVGTATLKNGSDYALSYKNNTNAGTATMTVSGKGNYTGIKNTTFKISAASLAKAAVSGIATKTYNGKAQTQAPTVKLGTITLKNATDYVLSYKNNTNAGTATMTITGKGNYTASLSKIYKIKKAANPLSVKAKTATVKASSLKKKKQTLGVSKVISTIKKGIGSVTYTKKSGNAKITIAAKTGKVTVKKGLKHGTYNVKVAVKAAGNANYKDNTKTILIKVIVK